MILWIALASAQDAGPEAETDSESTESTEADATDPAEKPDSTEPDETEAPDEPEPSEPEPPPKTFEIPPLDAPLPSATRTVKDLEAITSDPAELEKLIEEAGFDEDDFAFGSLVRGSWYVRPSFAVASLIRDGDGGSAVRMGFSAGRRFWTLEALPYQLAADIGIKGTAPVGAANGRRLEAQGAIGPWLGPARIQLTAGAKWERERWVGKTLELQDAWFITAGAGVAFDFDRIQINAGFTPTFALTEGRERATVGDPTLPVIGTETVYSIGLGIPLNPIGIALDGSWRDTQIGSVLEVGLAFQFTPRRRK